MTHKSVQRVDYQHAIIHLSCTKSTVSVVIYEDIIPKPQSRRRLFVGTMELATHFNGLI